MWKWESFRFSFKKKKAICRGIEISQSGVNECVKKGLSVIQGDANYDLDDYPDDAFSTVILSQTIQAMIFPDIVIKNLIRIGRRAIISFPNFGYWKVRKDLLFKGKMPKMISFHMNGLIHQIYIYAHVRISKYFVRKII